MKLSFQQIMLILKELDSDISLNMRDDGNWYVNSRLEIKDHSVLVSISSNGETPQQAIQDFWSNITNIPKDQYIVVSAYGNGRKAVRWSGHIWQKVIE